MDPVLLLCETQKAPEAAVPLATIPVLPHHWCPFWSPPAGCSLFLACLGMAQGCSGPAPPFTPHNGGMSN
jgi:hypothetical protein